MNYLKPVGSIALSGGFGALVTLAANPLAGGIVGVATVAFGLLAETGIEALEKRHLLSDRTAIILKASLWGLLMIGTLALGVFLAGPIGMLLALPPFIFLVLTLKKTIETLRTETKEIETATLKRNDKSVNMALETIQKSIECVNRFYEQIDEISPREEDKEFFKEKRTALQEIRQNILKVYDPLKSIKGPETSALIDMQEAVSKELEIFFRCLNDSSFKKILESYGFKLKVEEETPSLI